VYSAVISWLCHGAAMSMGRLQHGHLHSDISRSSCCTADLPAAREEEYLAAAVGRDGGPEGWLLPTGANIHADKLMWVHNITEDSKHALLLSFRLWSCRMRCQTLARWLRTSCRSTSRCSRRRGASSSTSRPPGAVPRWFRRQPSGAQPGQCCRGSMNDRLRAAPSRKKQLG